MNIGFIGNDQELCRLLRQASQTEGVFSTQETNDMQLILDTLKTCKLILISDRLVQPHELESLKELFLGKAELVYLISYKADTPVIEETKLVCMRHGIGICHPKRTVEQLVEFIQQQYLGGGAPVSKQGGQVIALVGTRGQTGLTATTFSLADEIGRRMGRKVAVIGLDAFSPGDTFITYAGSYLNDLYTQIKDGGILTPAELVTHMQQAKNFAFLAGNTDITKRYRYSSESVAHVIACAREIFDVVLLDAGSNPDNNLCLQALLHADMRVVVTTQQPAALTNWHRYIPLFRMVSSESMSFMLLINKWSKQWGDTKEIERSMAVPLLGWLPDLKDDGMLCEMERRLLTTVDHSKYAEQLKQMVDLLQSRFKWPAQEETPARKWRFGRRATS
jgi:MinD-like ATPase involved in chromosome partitioning or flagellar assembly